MNKENYDVCYANLNRLLVEIKSGVNRKMAKKADFALALLADLKVIGRGLGSADAALPPEENCDGDPTDYEMYRLLHGFGLNSEQLIKIAKHTGLHDLRILRMLRTTLGVTLDEAIALWAEFPYLACMRARRLFMDAFFERHPEASLPTWFGLCTFDGKEEMADGSFRFSITAISRSFLSAGLTWEESGNGYMLVNTNPETGARSVWISWSAGEKDLVKIFVATVEPALGSVSIEVDLDLDSIAEVDLLPFRKSLKTGWFGAELSTKAQGQK